MYMYIGWAGTSLLFKPWAPKAPKATELAPERVATSHQGEDIVSKLKFCYKLMDFDE